jgi:XTP/dITP diphosphohydrolase
MVSTNKNKVASISRSLARYKINVKHINLSLPELQSDDFNEVATEKAKAAFERTGKPCIVHDSGFFVTALNGFPGVLTHPVLDMVGIEGILKLTEGKPRECGFVHCIAYYDGSIAAPKLFRSENMGTMSRAPKGSSNKHHWSRLFEIYIPNGESKTLAQMTAKEYWKWRDANSVDESTTDFAKWYLKRK